MQAGIVRAASSSMKIFAFENGCGISSERLNVTTCSAVSPFLPRGLTARGNVSRQMLFDQIIQGPFTAVEFRCLIDPVLLAGNKKKQAHECWLNGRPLVPGTIP